MRSIITDPDVPFPGEQPFFTDLLSDLQNEDATIGLNGIIWNADLYPNLYKHKDRLVDRFNRKYAFREIGAETVTRWMHLLQNRYDEVAPKFDHAYKMYDDESLNLDNLTLGYVRNILYENASSGSSQASGTSEANSKFRDTPTNGASVINNPTTENQDNGSSSSTGSDSRTGSGNSKETYDYHDDHTLIEVNKLIDKFKSLDEDFINRFNEMFIGIMTILE